MLIEKRMIKGAAMAVGCKLFPFQLDDYRNKFIRKASIILPHVQLERLSFRDEQHCLACLFRDLGSWAAN
jgi:hypothetical protein